tara:strand:+ start:10997 stop:11359 length:363 start_codon:yes stop_codon:yes gene_type:complete
VIKFRLLLWVLGKLMKRAAKKNPAFQEQLKGQNMAFQLQIDGQKVVRHYVISDNRIKSKGKAHPSPEFTISFKNERKGLKIMTSKDRNAFMKGIQEKDITISGDLSKVMWFQGISKYLKP